MPASVTRAVPTSPGVVADRVHLRCRDHDDTCSDAIGMLVRAEGETRPLEETLRCTASLIAPDRVLTASHCLLPSERRTGSACASEWIAFPARGGRPMEWVACAAVEHADAVDDARVMRSDVAILRLQRAVERPILTLDLEPPAEGSIVTVVAVRPHPIYPSQHEVAGRRCRVATRASAVDTFGREAARVGWLMDCPSYPGNSGSPVLDGRGRVRAIMHAGSAPGHGVGITSALPR